MVRKVKTRLKRRQRLDTPAENTAPILDDELVAMLRSIPDAPYVLPTPEELAQRERAFDEILRLREEIGPIGVSVVDLIRQDRGWPGEEPQDIASIDI